MSAARTDTGLLLNTLRALEVELHRPEVRGNAARLHALLHPDFEEVGRSGRQWGHADTVAALLSESVPVEVVSDQYAVLPLGPDAALLTYRSAHRQADDGLGRHTLRASLWVRVDGVWQMRYHQGTPAAEIW
ncbi:nuclear transport factor 2 family protein [Paucibacter sp. M5-1]|uniref:nuclear transport factor 2 family protein n=1 Tax=Paucibacter sp. M5-1 TaxID=3015998 RepID=UPI0022B85BF9|nr:nuclear transport factor 2 family protein [Paucibacter sp. M5-1]MCZ7880870.1 nuclear transport factor 2 family protein [Paucibacter sp. M5-1]